MVCDVLNDFSGCEQLLGVIVGDLETEFIFHGHDDFHVIEGIQTEVVGEMGINSKLIVVDFVVQIEDQKNTFPNGFEVERRATAVLSSWEDESVECVLI